MIAFIVSDAYRWQSMELFATDVTLRLPPAPPPSTNFSKARNVTECRCVEGRGTRGERERERERERGGRGGEREREVCVCGGGGDVFHT